MCLGLTTASGLAVALHHAPRRPRADRGWPSASQRRPCHGLRGQPGVRAAPRGFRGRSPRRGGAPGGLCRRLLLGVAADASAQAVAAQDPGGTATPAGRFRTRPRASGDDEPGAATRQRPAPAVSGTGLPSVESAMRFPAARPPRTHGCAAPRAGSIAASSGSS